MIQKQSLIKDTGLRAKFAQTARVIMTYSSRSSEESYRLAVKLYEFRSRFLDSGPQLMAYYNSKDGRVHVVLAELLKTCNPISLFIPFHNLLANKKKLLTMRITHFLGFVQKKIFFLEEDGEAHETYSSDEGFIDGEFINHNSKLDQ